MRERDLFIEALQKTDPADRIAYLDAACSGDEVLRGRVLELLAQHEKNESFLLDAPAPLPHVSPNATIDQPISEAGGTVIGPYKLVEPIGEGGMGTVWMAQQTEPVKRLVALKVIKEGMDSKQVLARFEAERQALALMDHPLGVGVLDRVADGHEQFQPLPRGQAVVVTELGDRDALDQLHHEERSSIERDPRVVDLGDVRVVHEGQGLALGLEPGQHLPGIHPRLDQLDGHGALDRLGLLGHPDRAHAPFADRFQELVSISDHQAGGFGRHENCARDR